jgi:hypothetical protein
MQTLASAHIPRVLLSDVRDFAASAAEKLHRFDSPYLDALARDTLQRMDEAVKQSRA